MYANAIIDSSRFMFDQIMPLFSAVKGYALYDKMMAKKVVFKQ